GYRVNVCLNFDHFYNYCFATLGVKSANVQAPAGSHSWGSDYWISTPDTSVISDALEMKLERKRGAEKWDSHPVMGLRKAFKMDPPPATVPREPAATEIQSTLRLLAGPPLRGPEP